MTAICYFVTLRRSMHRKHVGLATHMHAFTCGLLLSATAGIVLIPTTHLLDFDNVWKPKTPWMYTFVIILHVVVIVVVFLVCDRKVSNHCARDIIYMTSAQRA